MTVKMRKLIVIAFVAGILIPTTLVTFGEWLVRAGVAASALCTAVGYLTGAATAIVAALLILVPTKGAARSLESCWAATCPVCEQQLRPGGRYCPACGSRVAA